MGLGEGGGRTSKCGSEKEFELFSGKLSEF